MESAKSILEEIKPLGRESYKNILLRHGVKEPCFGVKIEDLKKIQKRIKKDYALALELYDTGVYDAMYLAGLIADDARMTKRDLQHWVEKAGETLVGSIVPWVAAGSPHGREMGMKWIESKDEMIAAAGWTTLGSVVSLKADGELDLSEIKTLMERVGRTIHQSPNAVRYAMNGFIIAVGSYVAPLTASAKEIAEKLGRVSVDVGETACQVPFAPDYIAKVENKGAIGKKRKNLKC